MNLSDWWTKNENPNWLAQRKKILGLMEDQAKLERMARIVGKDAMPPSQQLTLLCASLVDDSFLRQSAFSEVDRFCSVNKQNAMLRILMRFFDQSEVALARGANVQAIADSPFFRRISRMGEEITDDTLSKFEELDQQMEAELSHLGKGADNAV